VVPFKNMFNLSFEAAFWTGKNDGRMVLSHVLTQLVLVLELHGTVLLRAGPITYHTATDGNQRCISSLAMYVIAMLNEH